MPAYTNQGLDLSEEIISQQLAEKYRRVLKAEKNKNSSLRRIGNAIQQQLRKMFTEKPQWWINLNKGLLVEFVIFIISQGFNFFTNCWVLIQVFQVLSQVQVIQQELKNQTLLSSLNYTTPGICQGIRLDLDKVDDQANHFETITIVYCIFMGFTSILILTHFVSWLYTLYLSMAQKEVGEKGREALVKMKLFFLAGASFLQDIPLSTLTAEIFAVQQGQAGITCLLCKVVAGKCNDQKVLQSILSQSADVLVLNIVAISATSLWKGISSFYRWSKIPNFEMFFIRACTSLFVGFLFIIVVLTPAMMILKYRYYALPTVPGGLIEDLIDRVSIIGVIFWVMVMAVVCCCPLLYMIRVGGK